jgi:hypothetical protein
LPQQTFEVTVCRDQDEVVSGGMFQNPAITGTSKAFVEKQLHPLETLRRANSAA